MLVSVAISFYMSIGATTMASSVGLGDPLTKMFRRWKLRTFIYTVGLDFLVILLPQPRQL